MDFALTQAQQERCELAAEVRDRVIAPAAKAATDEGRRLTAEELRGFQTALVATGYVGGVVPEDAGGPGLGFVDYGLLLEALARGPVPMNEVVLPRLVYWLGNDDQRARFLPHLLSGEWLSTSAITEPHAGSDVRALRTTAVRDGDEYRLTGTKAWVSFGPVADAMAVLAQVDENGSVTTNRLILERSVSPWSTEDVTGVGLESLPYGACRFDDVRVPVENVIGTYGSGREAFHRGMEASRAWVAMKAIGIAANALDTAARYVKQRPAFGRTLAALQGVQLTLADAAIDLEAARMLALSALWRLDQGQPSPREASMAKVKGTEAAVRACGAAMEAMGAFGLSHEAGVERAWRDAKMFTIADGAPTIQRLIVGREMLGTAAFV